MRGDERKTGEGWFGLGPVNWALLGAGALAIVVGYVLLDRGSVTAAPILLVLGYVVFIPSGLYAGYRRLGDGEADGG